MVPLAAIQAVPIQVIAWYRLHRYAWYRYSAIVNFIPIWKNHICCITSCIHNSSLLFIRVQHSAAKVTLFSLNHQEKRKNSASHQQNLPKSAKFKDRIGLYLYFVNLYEKGCHTRIQNLIINRNQIRNISNQLFPSIHNDTRRMRSQYNLTVWVQL